MSGLVCYQSSLSVIVSLEHEPIALQASGDDDVDLTHSARNSAAACIIVHSMLVLIRASVCCALYGKTAESVRALSHLWSN